MRIVSLLPSTTEILFAIGAGDDVVGVTFECDFPPEALSRTIVSTSAMPHGLTPAEIDAYVADAMRRGEDLYHLDEGALVGLEADLVVTQDLCAVCAVDVSVVSDALDYLGCTAQVLTIDPHTVDEVLASYLTLGEATGHLDEAEALAASQRARLDAVERPQSRPRVMFLEWTDPPFAPGHWVPEMISLAGGEPLLGTVGEKSRRVTWDQVHAAEPELVVVGPCGYDRAGSQALADELIASGVLPVGVPVEVVDANASWARPGTRLAEGVEELAAILRRVEVLLPRARHRLVPPQGTPQGDPLSTTVEELQSRLRSPGQVVRAEDLEGAQRYDLMTVFETLPDGRCRTWIRAEGEAVRPLEFASEAEAVAEAEGRIFETAPQPGSIRLLDGPPPRTVEELKDAMAEVGRDPDAVTRAEVFREEPEVNGMAIFERRSLGTVRVIDWERGRRQATHRFLNEERAVLDYYESVKRSAGRFVTDLQVEQMRIRARRFRDVMEKAGRG